MDCKVKTIATFEIALSEEQVAKLKYILKSCTLMGESESDKNFRISMSNMLDSKGA